MMVKGGGISSKIFLTAPRIGVYSSIGRRKNNEDSAYYAVIKTIAEDMESFYIIAVVADGMGGHAKGEVASRIACTNIGSYLAYYCSLIREDNVKINFEDAFNYAFTLAHNKIVQYSTSSHEYQGMGTTVTATIIERSPNGLDMWIGHIGDTRAYVITQSYIRQLTKDHSLVQALIDSGQLTPEEARRHPHRNVITRALGVSDAKPDIISSRLDEGSFVLICSDGLVGSLYDNELHRIVISGMFKSKSPTYILSKLVEIALSRGEKDNITGILIGPLYSLRH